MQIKKIQGPLEKQKGIHYEYDADSTPIGEGGMGVVYRGIRIDENTGQRTEVAIKALHDDLPEEVYARAEREASIQLRHDNLVEMLGLISVYETTQWGETTYHHYVISEFLHGIELSDLLIGKLDNKFNEDNTYARNLYNSYLKDRKNTSIKIIKKILSGVLALHDKGYIHRDIDPSNIMVTNDGHIKLIDFGIAKNLRALSSNDKLRTATGKFIGKAEYAPPELVLGDVKNQNYTTDIYALGILLYRLLVGELPFNGSQYEVLQQQLKNKVPVKNIENIALAKVVKKATEKIQGHRYSSIAEFRVAIDKAENEENSFWDIYGKYIIILIALIVSTFGVYQYINYLKEKEKYKDADTEIVAPSPSVPNEHQQFINALSLLDSNNPDSVKVGFKQMEQLANAGYESAKVEIGITYLPEPGSSVLERRRKYLNFNNRYSPDKVIEYLSSVENEAVFTPDVYFILGHAYTYKEGETGDYSSTKKCFKKALELINSGTMVSHGYDADDMAPKLRYNIDIIEKNE